MNDKVCIELIYDKEIIHEGGFITDKDHLVNEDLLSFADIEVSMVGLLMSHDRFFVLRKVDHFTLSEKTVIFMTAVSSDSDNEEIIVVNGYDKPVLDHKNQVDNKQV